MRVMKGISIMGTLLFTMPEPDPIGNQKENKEQSQLVYIETNTDNEFVIGTVENIVFNEEVKKLKEKLERLEKEKDELCDSINNGCELWGVTRDAKMVRNFRRTFGFKFVKNEDKLPKKLRNGWK